ncbi:MAG: hypothetical protein U5Q03_17030 [Bacteroidota bacterium]|nr:hypothetical protein [Bacteroidota bacterium]
MASSKKGKQSYQKKNLTRESNQQNLLFTAVIILFCIGLYFNTYWNGFNMDDHYVTATNMQTSQGFSAIPDIFTSVYGDEMGNKYGYRPLTRASFTIDHELWEGAASWSHMFNLLLYITFILVLFSLLKRLLRNYNPYFPFVIVVLFLAHPAFTEVVASLKNRDIILSSLFGLLALKAFIRWIDHKKTIPLISGIFLYILAVLSKETAFAFIFLYPLVFYYFTNISLRKLWIFFGAGLLLTLVLIFGPGWFIPDMGRTYRFTENPLVDENFFTRFTTGMYVILLYLKKLIFPYPLLYYYGYNTIPLKGLFDFWVIFSILLHLALFIYAIRNFKQKSLLSFAILFYLLNIGMVSNILSPVPGIMAERFLFLPGISFAIILAYFIFKLFKQDPKNPILTTSRLSSIIILTLVILIPYSAYTFNRNKNWRTYYTLYSHDIKHLEESVKANDLLATELVSQLNDIFNSQDPNRVPPPINSQRRPIETALKHYKKVIEIYPEHYNAWNNIGTIHYRILKKPDLAIPFYEKTIEIKPDFPNPYVNLADIYAERGSVDTAIRLYSKVYELDSSRVSPLSRIANIYYQAGETEKAKETNYRIMELHPDSYFPYLNLGFYAAREGDSLQAEKNLEKAVQKGYEGNIYSIMTRMYLEMGNRKQAYLYDMKSREFEKKRNNQN